MCVITDKAGVGGFNFPNPHHGRNRKGARNMALKRPGTKPQSTVVESHTTQRCSQLRASPSSSTQLVSQKGRRLCIARPLSSHLSILWKERCNIKHGACRCRMYKPRAAQRHSKTKSHPSRKRNHFPSQTLYAAQPSWLLASEFGNPSSQ